MKSLNIHAFVTAITVITAIGLNFSAAKAAFLIEVDIDGADDGIATPSPNFSFGGDTSTASQSVAGSAVGLTGGDSLFGGDGSAFIDTYVFSYTPGLDVDNLALTPGTDLNGADVASGIVGGSSGIYNVYATWPMTANVSGGDTTFSINHDSGALSISVDQNSVGDTWFKVGEVSLTAGNNYRVEQTTETNTFVSMRGGAVMFESSQIPEPSTAMFLIGALTGFAVRRHR